MTEQSALRRAEDGWAEKIGPYVRAVLTDAKVTAEAIEWILEDLRPRVIEIMLNTPEVKCELPVAAQAEVTNLYARNAVAALTQLVRLERELYEARFDRSALTKAELDAQMATVMPAGSA